MPALSVTRVKLCARVLTLGWPLLLQSGAGGFNEVEPPQGGLAPVTTTMVFDMVTVSACSYTSACMHRWRLRQRKPKAFSIGAFAVFPVTGEMAGHRPIHVSCICSL